MENEAKLDKKNGNANFINKVSKYIDKKTLVTLCIVYLLFIGLPWLYNNRNELLSKNTDFIIKIPTENFGVEPNSVLEPYGFDLIPKDKNKVVNIKRASCTPNWENFLVTSTPKSNDKDEKSQQNEDSSPDRNFKPLLPLPLDSPTRLFCQAVKLPDIPGQYSFTISVESDSGKQTKEVKFYVTKPLGELE